MISRVLDSNQKSTGLKAAISLNELRGFNSFCLVASRLGLIELCGHRRQAFEEV